jgi:hypothetical protein
VVGSVEVVCAGVLLQVLFEPGEADVEVAGEGVAPAFFEHEAVEGLNGAVCLWPAGADQGVACVELVERLAEVG